MKPIMLGAALALLGLAACADDAAGPLTLSDGTWVVERIGEATMQAPLPTIEFRPDGKFGGVASCNTYGGSWTDEGGRLSLTGLFSTKMACDDRRMAQERTLFAALGNGGAYRLTASEIAIDGAGGQRIEARRVLIRRE